MNIFLLQLGGFFILIGILHIFCPQLLEEKYQKTANNGAYRCIAFASIGIIVLGLGLVFNFFLPALIGANIVLGVVGIAMTVVGYLALKHEKFYNVKA